MSDRFERDVLVGIGRMTAAPWVVLWYFAVWTAWFCTVGIVQCFFWIYEIAVWIVATATRRPFSFQATVETMFLTPPWGMDRYAHPSKRRRDRRRKALRDRHLTDADRTLHLEALAAWLDRQAVKR